MTDLKRDKILESNNFIITRQVITVTGSLAECGFYIPFLWQLVLVVCLWTWTETLGDILQTETVWRMWHCLLTGWKVECYLVSWNNDQLSSKLWLIYKSRKKTAAFMTWKYLCPVLWHFLRLCEQLRVPHTTNEDSSSVQTVMLAEPSAVRTYPQDGLNTCSKSGKPLYQHGLTVRCHNRHCIDMAPCQVSLYFMW
jgi:hypothetical protein